MNNIPIGTYLSRLQYAKSEGRLPDAPNDDRTQPFHFGVLKAELKEDDQEFMIYSVSTFPQMRQICGAFHAMYFQFLELTGDEPTVLESGGMKCAFQKSPDWNALLVLITFYKFSSGFLTSHLQSLNYALAYLFPEPNIASAKFANNALIHYSKTMSGIEGIDAVLSNYKVPNLKKPNFNESDTILTDVGPASLVEGAVGDNQIYSTCSVFVYERALFSNMECNDMAIAELLVANMRDPTEEYETIDGRLFCLARHYHTYMISITEPGKGLERCCKMQVALMKLESMNIIRKMQAAFAKRLPPNEAADILVSSGIFNATQPPFLAAPLFAQPSPALEAAAVASMMYSSMARSSHHAIVNFLLDKTRFTVIFAKQGDAFVFSVASKPVDDKEITPLPALLKALQP